MAPPRLKTCATQPASLPPILIRAPTPSAGCSFGTENAPVACAPGSVQSRRTSGGCAAFSKMAGGPPFQRWGHDWGTTMAPRRLKTWATLTAGGGRYIKTESALIPAARVDIRRCVVVVFGPFLPENSGQAKRRQSQHQHNTEDHYYRSGRSKPAVVTGSLAEDRKKASHQGCSHMVPARSACSIIRPIRLRQAMSLRATSRM